MEALEIKMRWKWLNTMNKEMYSLEKNHTWELIKSYERHMVFGCELIFMKKRVIMGIEFVRCK